MTLKTTLALTAIALFGSVSCSSDTKTEHQAADLKTVDLEKTAPVVDFKPGKESYDGTVSKPGAPYSISYRIIGTPIVGSPTTVDLKVTSTLGPRPVTLSYRINDASSMMLGESQPDQIYMEPADNEKAMTEQVTLIPQRDGRLYLNVSASFETDTGTMSTVAAIPIQVGSGTRDLIEQGTVETDENGEAVRVLSLEQ